MAEVRNAMPLPPIKPHCGLRLPPDRYCLSACNYKLRAANQSKKMTKSALEGRSTIKTQIKGSGAASGGASNRQTVMTPKTQVVTIPKPVIKFTTTAKTVAVDSKQGITIGVTQDNSSDVKMEVDADNSAIGIITSSSSMQGTSGGNGSGGGVKREREDDEFEVVP